MRTQRLRRLIMVVPIKHIVPVQSVFNKNTFYEEKGDRDREKAVEH